MEHKIPNVRASYRREGQLKVVLDEQGWDDLAASEWRTLSNITCLLQPFAKFTSLLSGDEYTTLSCVIPAIMDINIHLEEVCYNFAPT